MVYIKRHTIPSEFLIEGWDQNYNEESAKQFLKKSAEEGIKVTEINEGSQLPFKTKIKILVDSGFTLQGKVVGTTILNDPNSYKYLPGNTGFALDARLHKVLKKEWVIPIWQLQEIRYNSTISPNFTQYREVHEKKYYAFSENHPTKAGKPDIFSEGPWEQKKCLSVFTGELCDFNLKQSYGKGFYLFCKSFQFENEKDCYDWHRR